MILEEPLLVMLLKLVDCIPTPAPPQKRGRGHCQTTIRNFHQRQLEIPKKDD